MRSHQLATSTEQWLKKQTTKHHHRILRSPTCF